MEEKKYRITTDGSLWFAMGMATTYDSSGMCVTRHPSIFVVFKAIVEDHNRRSPGSTLCIEMPAILMDMPGDVHRMKIEPSSVKRGEKAVNEND